MELLLNKTEITKAVTQFAAEQSIEAESIDVVISWQASAFQFPPNIAEILSHCDVKAVVKVKDKETRVSLKKVASS